MCGVGGIYAYHPLAQRIDKQELITIRDAMVHRGPDGKGLWCASNHRVGLAHRRLAIIDPSCNGLQPMVSTDKQVVISFNGEIYNYRALRKKLLDKGYRFNSHSDTEVIVNLYKEVGISMLTELRGMFALIIWDNKKQKMLVARDTYGIKPLYYADDGRTIRVASQVKALMTSSHVSRIPDPAGIVGFYLLGSIPEPYTRYSQVRSVPAGSYIEINQNGLQRAIEWKTVAHIFASAENQAEQCSYDELQERVRNSLLDTIEHHLISDVPVGVFLSAGIDSGSILGLMSEMPRSSMSESYQSITIGFDEYQGTKNDETLLAAQVANQYGSRHSTNIVTKDDFHQEIPKILNSMDQPSTDGINTWFACKAAREQGMKVMLSGIGGDELFAGYPSFKDIPKFKSVFRLPSKIPFLGSLLSHIGRLHSIDYITSSAMSNKVWSLLEYGGNDAGAWFLRRGIFMPKELKSIFDTDFLRMGLDELNLLHHIDNQVLPMCQSDYAKIASLESSLYMRNQLLRDADWTSMAFSMELRTPLVDTELTKNIASLLVKNKQYAGKSLLAKSPRNALDSRVVNRAKTGFTTPIAQWLQSDTLLKNYFNKPKIALDYRHWSQQYTYVLGEHFFSGSGCFK